MRYGFIIDNRKCIGCHACTTACKSEHQVPVGVNRTWVKQVEKGTFPDTRRLFSVMRCNHCTDAPCVSICPTEALHFRPDGIVDFDNDRCIGCKSCMQACPYDALYIDPDNNTAAKCNYCAHRIDVGLEPACVNVCPEHAIISGDMENPETEIAQLLARQAVKTRKPEKATVPNLFYIDADDVSLISTATDRSNISLWGSQSLGVGHFAKEAEKMAFSNSDVLAEVMNMNSSFDTDNGKVSKPKTVEVLMDETKQVYNTPDKGILWGWEVSAYVWTKAISAGIFLMAFLGWVTGLLSLDSNLFWWTIGIGIGFLGLTGLLLIKDLDRPDRFLYVLLRPHWESWLVKGGYAISVFGGLLTLLAVSKYFGWDALMAPLMYMTALAACIVAVYTAFLFAQAKGRDFWQSPTLAIHMLVHSLMAGAGVFLIISLIENSSTEWNAFTAWILLISIIVNLVVMLFELVTTHPTMDAKIVVNMILKGRYKTMFWLGVLAVGNMIPLVMLLSGMSVGATGALIAVFVLAGIYMTEHIWVEAPQRIPLS
ncbi:MAG: polysulfide reductase NrfD [Saprospiraceae bacterium]|nr:polysulfide reductase NrfD [Saprospiraceae bacterium]